MTIPPGILLVKKPAGPTSHDIVARVRKAAGIRRVGHAGTLDPFASGLLLVLLGHATRLAEFLVPLDKTYEAVARLGIETSTHDPEGEAVLENESWRSLQEDAVRRALDAFAGPILQTPPRFSSKKVRGEPAHRRARRGEDVALAPAGVTIHEIGLLELCLPNVRFRVRCSSGTYIRALARDLGRQLSVGAHLTSLIRTEIGAFRLSEAVPLEALVDEEGIRMHLLPPALALSHLPSIEIPLPDAQRIRQGQSLSLGEVDLPEGRPLRILVEGALLAIGTLEGDQLRPRKVFGDA